jgi:hypothetical protein
MKIDISYLTSPQTWFSRFPISSRILTSNIVNDKRFNVHFTEQIPLICYTKAFNIWKTKYRDMITGKDPYDIFVTGTDISYGRFPLFYIFTGALDNIILENIKTEIVFLTANTVLDFRIAKILLKDKRKVVMGGSATMIYEPHEIRTMLSHMGVEAEAKDNLIIVSGYVDLKTDLYDIFSKWVDKTLTENDFSTFWDCTEDGFMDYVKIYRKLFGTNLNGLMTSKCWYGKCRFCTYGCLPKVDFTDDVSVQRIIDHFKTLRKNYESNNIFFNDSYMVNTPYNKEVLMGLTEEGFEVSIYTGVKLLNNKKYLDFVNEVNMGRLCIGIESLSNYALDYINKGYGFGEIARMVEGLKDNLNRNITPIFLIMCDLPVSSIKRIRTMYRALYYMRHELANAGIGNGVGCQFNLSPLRHYPKTNLIDGDVLRHAHNRKDLMGILGLYEYFHEKLDINIDEVRNTNVLNQPMHRYLPDGEQIKSDIHYVDEKFIKDIVEWKFPQGF